MSRIRRAIAKRGALCRACNIVIEQGQEVAWFDTLAFHPACLATRLRHQRSSHRSKLTARIHRLELLFPAVKPARRRA